MKYCPQCNRQFPDAWITFCTDDGSLLREDLTPPADPNWDPQIRNSRFDDPAASEQATQWLPRDSPAPGAWMPPDERAPMARPWQPPPPAPVPIRTNTQNTPPGLSVASFFAGLLGLMFGWFCAFPIPGLLAVIFGLIALGQLKNKPHRTGRGFAIAGLIMGGINLAFFFLWILWFIFALAFG